MGTQLLTVKQKETKMELWLKDKPDLFATLPKHITSDRMLAVVMNCMRSNPKLLECTPASILDSVRDAATLGLQPSGVLGHAYFVPYNNKRANTVECQLIVGYKGLIDLARRSGTVSTITMEIVREGDYFEYAKGDTPYIHHQPSEDPDREEKPVTYVYVVVKLRDGGIQRNVWPASKIEKHAKKYSYAYAQGKKDSPWFTDWEVMAKKTVLRDMINRGEVPVSAEVQTQTMKEEIIEAGRFAQLPSYKPVASLEDLTNRLTGVEPQDSTEPIDVPTEPEPVKAKRQPKAATPEYTATDGSLFPDDEARFEAENPMPEHP